MLLFRTRARYLQKYLFPLAIVVGLPLQSPAQKLLKSNRITGTTEPYNSSTISATVAGRLSVIRKKEGDYVKKGDVILELEKVEEELEATLRKLIAESKVEVSSARYRDSILNRDYLSTKQLFDSSKSVSEEELMNKELEHTLATAEYERLLILEKKEQIEYEIALAQINKRIVVAPFNGIVVKVFFKIAESCNPQEPLVRIVDISKCRFIAHVESGEMFNLAAGAKVELSFGGGTALVLREGTVEFVSPVVDPSSELFDVKILFENADAQIKPGIAGIISKGETR